MRENLYDDNPALTNQGPIMMLPDPAVVGLNDQFTVEIRMDQFSHSVRDEDGNLLIGEEWFVCVTNRRGRRWRYFQSFPTRIVNVSDGMGYTLPMVFGHEAARAYAVQLAGRIAAELDAGKRLNRELWTEVRPVYGSDWYIASGAEQDQIEIEHMEG